MVEIEVVKERTEKLIDTLFTLWNGSVRKTHTFLQEEDIVKLYPFVKDSLRQVEHLVVLEENGRILGFIGMQDHKIEMLFIEHRHFKRGYGKKLVAYGMEHFDVNEVSVNEDNPNAKAFYGRLGFKVYARH